MKTLFKFITLFTIILLSIFNISSYNKIIEKEIYLTFDDGPGANITKQTLDILKESQVCATFFLIGNQVKDEPQLVKRMVDEGHSLGIHSMTHNRNSLYSSNESFLKEMKLCQSTIYDTTGIKSNILRFPFGCNNNSYKLKKNLVDLLHQNSLKIYDWNVDTTDGANPHSSPDLFVKNSISNKNRIILLMHCGILNKNSPKALKSIIKYYKDKGYSFKKIDDNTPEEFHYYKK